MRLMRFMVMGFKRAPSVGSYCYIILLSPYTRGEGDGSKRTRNLLLGS